MGDEGVARDEMRCWSNAAFRSSKSALHALVHWLASAYAKKGVTVNAVAPALIGGTALLPGNESTLVQREKHSDNHQSYQS